MINSMFIRLNQKIGFGLCLGALHAVVAYVAIDARTEAAMLRSACSLCTLRYVSKNSIPGGRLYNPTDLPTPPPLAIKLTHTKYYSNLDPSK